MNSIIFMKNKYLQLKPGEKIPISYLDQLKEVNAQRQKDGFPTYKKRIAHVFGIQPQSLTKEKKIYLGGFVEGEGSLNLSLRPTITTVAGVSLDFHFSLTQHVNGIHTLYSMMDHLQTGRIRHKGGSNATMYFEIGDRLTVREKVLPFYKDYVLPFCPPPKKERFQKFETLLNICDQKNAFIDKQILIHEIVPRWDELRMQRGQSNEAFESEKDAIQFIQNCFGQPQHIKEKFNQIRIQRNLSRR